MEFETLLEKLKEVELSKNEETKDKDIVVEKLKIYLEWDYEQSQAENNFFTDFYNDNAKVINNIIKNINRSIDSKDALLYYYGYSLSQYQKPLLGFDKLIKHFREQLVLVPELNIDTLVLSFFESKAFNKFQQIVSIIENNIDQKYNIRNTYLLCRVMLFDDDFLNTTLLYKGLSHPGYYILFDILGNELYNRGIMEINQSLEWKKLFADYCDCVKEVLETYRILSKLRVGIYSNDEQAEEILNNTKMPDFLYTENVVEFNNLVLLYIPYLILLNKLCEYEKIDSNCDKILQVLRENQYNNKWLFDYIYKFKFDTLSKYNQEKLSKDFFDYVRGNQIGDIGNLVFLMPYLNKSNNDKSNDVYHYSDIKALQSIIDNRQLWLTRYDYLNDSEEMKFILKVIENLKDALCQEPKFKEYIDKCVCILNLYFEGDYKEYSEIIDCIINTISNVYVLSTSCQDDNLSLWHYYSDGKGVSIKINANKLKEQVESINKLTDQMTANIFMKEIDYLEKFQKKFKKVRYIFNSLEALFNDMNKKGLEEKHQLYLGCIFILFQGIFTKNKNMKQEKEFRFVTIITKDNKNNSFLNNQIKEEFRVKSDISLIPYITLKIDPIELIENVCIAPLNKSDLAKRGMIDYLESKDFKNADNMVNISEIKLRY